jgi:hypothetical protein
MGDSRVLRGFPNRLALRYTQRVSLERAEEYVRALSRIPTEALDDRALEMVTDARPRFWPSCGELKQVLLERWQEILDSRPQQKLPLRQDPTPTKPPSPEVRAQARAQVEALIAQCSVPFPRRPRSSDAPGE